MRASTEAVVAGGIAWRLLSPLRADLGQEFQRRLGQFRQLLLRDRRLPEPGQRDEINDVRSEGNLIGAVDENPLAGRREDEINEPLGGAGVLGALHERDRIEIQQRAYLAHLGSVSGKTERGPSFSATRFLL